MSNRIFVVSNTVIGGSCSVIPDGDRTDGIFGVVQTVVVLFVDSVVFRN